MRKTLIAGMLAVFLFTAMAPVALADGEPTDDNGEDRKEVKEERQEYREARKEYRDARKDLREERKEYKDTVKEYRKEHGDGPRGVRGNVSLGLDGLAYTRDNLTYTFELSAEGRGLLQAKVDKEGGKHVRLVARLAAHVVVTDANGTVVKEGDLRMKLYLRGDADAPKWTLVSVAKRDSGIPRLVLHGQAEDLGDGDYGLEGRGRGGFKPTGADSRVPVKLSVEGSLSFTPLPPPAPAPTPTAQPVAASEPTEPEAVPAE